MAGIEAVTQEIGPINPANLIGLASPVVEPRATAALTDAFHQGVVTADDIVSRFGEVGKSADAAKVMAAKEAVSPGSQAARAATQQAQTVAAQQATRRAQFPGTAAYDALAPGAGVEPPLLPNGQPDVQKENQIGTHLAAWDSTRKAAAEEEKRLVQHIDKETNTVMWLEPGGGPVPPARLAQLRKDAHMSFQDYIQKFPGIAATVFPGAGQFSEAPAVVAPVTPGVATSAQRVQVENQFPGAGSMADSDVIRMAGAQNAAAASPEVIARAVPGKPEIQIAGQPVGGGFALGPAPIVEPKPTPKGNAEQDKAQLALARFAQSNDMQASLKSAGFDPTSIGSWMNSLLPQIAKSGDQKMFEAAKDVWAQGLLRLESGAAISHQEKDWYNQAFFPQVRDPENVQLAKEALRHDTERMVAEIALKGGVVSPEAKAQAERIYKQAADFVAGVKTPGTANTPAAGANPNPVITNSLGKFQRDANGVPRRVQ